MSDSPFTPPGDTANNGGHTESFFSFSAGQITALKAQHTVVSTAQNSRAFDSIPFNDSYWSTRNAYIILVASYLT